MSDRSPKLLIEDILSSAQKIQRYTAGMTFEQFAADEKTIDAVARNFEIIGEAANRLPDEFKSQYSNIDWDRMRGFRNRIVHNYFGIDYSIVWNIIQSFLPALVEEFSTFVNDPGVSS